MLAFLLLACVVPICAFPQERQASEPEDWSIKVKKFSEAQNWTAALQIIDREIAHAPKDIDIRAWRARVLAWSGKLGEAEHEYLEIVNLVPQDPDNWAGLASVYLREGRTDEAVKTLDRAVELDPKRADLRAARGRALRAQGEQSEARLEFQKALELDPGSSEARAGLLSLVDKPKQELRFEEGNDLFNFANANHDESVSLVSHWSPYWTTSASGSFYQRGQTGAGKFAASVTGRLRRWGALTVGGAAGHDNGVIPKSETFFVPPDAMDAMVNSSVGGSPSTFRVTRVSRASSFPKLVIFTSKRSGCLAGHNPLATCRSLTPRLRSSCSLTRIMCVLISLLAFSSAIWMSGNWRQPAA